MKRLFIITVLLLVTSIGFSQKVTENIPKFDQKPIHFGFTFGFNAMDFAVKLSDDFASPSKIDEIYSVTSIPRYGFHLGPVSNFRINNVLELRALINLTFGQRDLEYLVRNVSKDGVVDYEIITMSLASTYIELPILLKYRSTRMGNYRPYVIGGINPKIDLAARKEVKDNEGPVIRLQKYDLAYEVGFGVDFYLEYFKFTSEIKFSR